MEWRLLARRNLIVGDMNLYLISALSHIPWFRTSLTLLFQRVHISLSGDSGGINSSQFLCSVYLNRNWGWNWHGSAVLTSEFVLLTIYFIWSYKCKCNSNPFICIQILGQQINDFTLPDVNLIGEHSDAAELGRMLQLILGCAVNCEQKQGNLPEVSVCI